MTTTTTTTPPAAAPSGPVPGGPAAALAAYRDALAPARVDGQCHEFSLTPVDRLGWPLWSVALVEADGALADGFGYGPDLTAARASAWGETLEWSAARAGLRRLPRRQGTYDDLRRAGLAPVDPVTLCLPAGSGYAPGATVLDWVEARRHPTGEPVWVPVEFVGPRYADLARPGADADPARFLTVPITNGLGAGPSFAHALAHGLMELLQRDGNSVRYRALDAGEVIDLDAVADPGTRELLAGLDRAGVEVTVKLAATDFGLTNLYVVGHDRDPAAAPHPLALSACGEAAHPDREFALAKALREFVSARARKVFNHGPLDLVRAVAPPGYLDLFRSRRAARRSEDDRAERAMRDWLGLSAADFLALLRPVFAARRRVPFSGLPTVDPARVADPDARLALLTERLRAAGREILYVEFTTPERSGVSVLRAIVPGLEVETMTYARLGGRNLRRLLAAGSPLVGVGEPRPPAARTVRLAGADAAEFGGDAWLDPAALERAVGDLYALYREPGRHVLALDDEERARASSS